jgi:hypothetical protein
MKYIRQTGFGIYRKNEHLKRHIFLKWDTEHVLDEFPRQVPFKGAFEDPGKLDLSKAS